MKMAKELISKLDDLWVKGLRVKYRVEIVSSLMLSSGQMTLKLGRVFVRSGKMFT